GLKAIAPVPTSNDVLDIVLSKTQRKTSTVIHKNFKISRIRNFYMRKVKFTQDSFDEKLSAILEEFPMLDDLHPFLSYLMNVLYDKNHYKLALGQLRTCRHLIDQVAKDDVRPATAYTAANNSNALPSDAWPLAYLEQVRQHISRLPAIDPNTRTLLICGYPNVGKSSFINKVTRADVDVQPYAFTTKSLFVGHLDYKYLRWQVIDTPGILDHPLEEMNTIEMQSITALAHLRACVLYFMDLSEQCGYTVGAQGVTDVKNTACDLLLAHSVETKLKGTKINSVANRIHVAVPKPRDEVVREPFIPEVVKERKKCDKEDPERRKLEKDLEAEEGGAGVYNLDMRKKYLLAMDEWKYDKMPEIMDGKNVADFIDPDIAEKLEALEREEERLQAEGLYDEEEDIFDSAAELDDANTKRLESQENKRTRNYPKLPRTAGLRTLSEMTEKMTAAGLDPSKIQERAAVLAKAHADLEADEEGTEVDGEGEDEWMGVDESDEGKGAKKGGIRKKRKSEGGEAVVVKKRGQPATNRQVAGLRDDTSDRAIKTKMPKHLFAGKRKMGKTNRR
ncbi:hypothetical protein M422DRAFT_38855, partial [Sphaerobolus stellatus SS14]